MSGGMKTGMDRFAAKGREVSARVRRERAEQHAAEVAPVIAELRADGATTLQAIATGLNKRNIRTARGHRWSAIQVRRVIARLVSDQARSEEATDQNPEGAKRRRQAAADEDQANP